MDREDPSMISKNILAMYSHVPKHQMLSRMHSESIDSWDVISGHHHKDVDARKDGIASFLRILYIEYMQCLLPSIRRVLHEVLVICVSLCLVVCFIKMYETTGFVVMITIACVLAVLAACCVIVAVKNKSVTIGIAPLGIDADNDSDEDLHPSEESGSQLPVVDFEGLMNDILMSSSDDSETTPAYIPSAAAVSEAEARPRVQAGKFLLIYICIFHVISNFLLV